jgi:two-component system KDP operon response regulator KdpE
MTSAAHAVLNVDDEPQLRRLVRTTLVAEGFRVFEAEDARRGLIEASSHKPDLVILDLGLPDADGHTVVRGIREWSSMPILVLSARVDEQQKIAALDAGADDYVTKPFAVGELLARVRAALRRSARAPDDQIGPLKLGEVAVDLARRQATRCSLRWRSMEAWSRRRGCCCARSGAPSTSTTRTTCAST